MKTHDIMGDEHGWAHLVDGVLTGNYPAWHLALNAARHAALADAEDGHAVTIRYQGLDGIFRPELTGPVSTRQWMRKSGGARVNEKLNPHAEQPLAP